MEIEESEDKKIKHMEIITIIRTLNICDFQIDMYF